MRPQISSQWWQVAGNPNLRHYGTPHQQPVDFAIWQAERQHLAAVVLHQTHRLRRTDEAVLQMGGNRPKAGALGAEGRRHGGEG